MMREHSAQVPVAIIGAFHCTRSA
eukprot:COSAG06_NODE_63480_length_262_cov_0.638037_1_plen_23_part_10